LSPLCKDEFFCSAKNFSRVTAGDKELDLESMLYTEEKYKKLVQKIIANLSQKLPKG